MRKIVVILFLITAIRTLLSCCKDEGYNFRWSGADLGNLDVSGDRGVLLTGNSATVTHYGLRISFQHEKVASRSSFAFSRAYATSCRPFFKNKDTIQSFDVIARYDFDGAHPAGSSVAGYLSARPADFYNYYPEYQYKPLVDYIGFLNEDQDKLIHNNELDMKFNTTSTVPGPQRFVITIAFKSGRVLEDSTEIVFQ